MNRLIKNICFVALVVMLSLGGATATADDTEPAWLLPLSQQDLLNRGEANHFPDFYSEPSLPFVIQPTEQIVRF
ncbi:MAG: hypothetical protein P8J43_09170, partial [Pirellulales bacterium]|nr:hypothetical protein [Pirellulales bacterium]